MILKKAIVGVLLAGLIVVSGCGGGSSGSGDSTGNGGSNSGDGGSSGQGDSSHDIAIIGAWSEDNSEMGIEDIWTHTFNADGTATVAHNGNKMFDGFWRTSGGTIYFSGAYNYTMGYSVSGSTMYCEVGGESLVLTKSGSGSSGDTTNDDLVGSWESVSDEVVTFNADGTYRVTSDGSTEDQGTWQTTGVSTLQLTSTGEDPIVAFFEIEDDTLTLLVSGLTSTFSRM